MKRFFSGLATSLEKAPKSIRESYRRMKTPNAFELYDLQQDPYEFQDLVSDPGHASILANLKQQLHDWRKETQDPLLDKNNLARLAAEIEACMVDGQPQKGKLELTYPDYFFVHPTRSN
jgi:N-sulfoglucosamine sulfohydrolase